MTTPHIVVPLMLLASSVLMALAWLGHIRFRKVRFALAVLGSWLLVLPEYLLNVSAIRYGHAVNPADPSAGPVYTGAAMASFNLCAGVLCVALVSRYFLKERITSRQVLGFALMAVAIVLIVYE